MNRRTDQERLLGDVLREEIGDGFDEALLGQTFRLARRRRQVRLVQRVGGVFILAVTATVALWRRPQAPVLEEPPPAPHYQLTFSQPLPASCVVSSHPLRAEQVVASMLTSSVVHTTTGHYQVLGDDELLALAPVPAALVRRGPHEAELVFVSPPAEIGGQQN